jgi:arylsulfatase A-like enzyme
MVGKWHLGMSEPYHPLRRGFDEYFGFLHGGHGYLNLRPDARNPILRGTQPVDEHEYLTDAFTREAVAFIDRHAKEPFFLYLTYNAVHAPLQAPAKYLRRFPKVDDDKRRTHLAMLSALDDGIGAVIEKLRAAGVEDDTLIFFISDNGGPTQATTAQNDPLKGVKGQLWEGGTRVPYIVQWKRRLPGGKTYDRPVISLDILPTALAAAGGQRPEDLDGVDILPYLAGRKNGDPHEALYWRFGASLAIRKGDWKVLKLQREAAMLFNLADDIGEKNDLAAARPEKVKELETDLNHWNAQLKEPLWNGAQGNPARQARRAEAAARGPNPAPARNRARTQPAGEGRRVRRNGAAQ